MLKGELVVDPSTVPAFFLGYLGAELTAGLWHTGDRVGQDEDDFLYFEVRADDELVRGHVSNLR